MYDEHLILRPAMLEDALFLFRLRNDPEARKNFFQTKEVEWETHLRWLEKVTLGDEILLFVAEIRESHDLCGQVRFDMTSSEKADISITVAPEYRGKGIGKRLIKAGIGIIRKEKCDLNTIVAYILPFNIASRKIFEKCGFVYQETENVKDNIMAEKWILKIR